MKNFVLGLAHSGWSVLLMHKNRPDWQRGTWNGIGGRIEEGETPHDAMLREAEEEAGLGHLPWAQKATLRITNPEEGEVTIFVFYAEFSGEFYQKTDERLAMFDVGDLVKTPLGRHLPWLIPICFFEKGNIFIHAGIEL